jgi:hypothetical protein
MLCDGHPDMAITHEFRFFSALDRSYVAHARFLLDDGVRRLRRNGLRVRWRLVLTTRYLWTLRRHHDRRRGGITAAAVEATLRELFPNKRIVGDKTPLYVLQLDRLARVPELSLLIVLRDPRDVVSSTLERVRHGWGAHWRNVNTADAVAQRWLRCVAAMEQHRERIRVIRYEELVQEPRRVFQALGEWLDVDPRGFQSDLIRGSSIGKYRTGLTRDEIDAVTQIAAPAMERLGYPLLATNP